MRGYMTVPNEQSHQCEDNKIDDNIRNNVFTTKDGRQGWVISPNSDGKVVARSILTVSSQN